MIYSVFLLIFYFIVFLIQFIRGAPPMGLYVSFAPFLLGAVFFSLSFNFLFSICYALLSFKYLSDMPNKVVKKNWLFLSYCLI